MQIQQSVMNGMLKNISDPRLRQTYGAILSGKYAYNVFCLNPQINPKTKKPFHAAKCLIGHLDPSGNVIDYQTLDKKSLEPVAGIETSRDRLDGRKGFRCYCGNWSIQSAEEKGVLQQSIAPKPPTQGEMQQIFMNIQKANKGQLQYINGWAEYDGFGLEEVQS